ncbi:MAG: bifunctional glutamate N-acetyltransferase/amino-acid acetyltransferase ArgJ [Candidatus Aureabacteria bacterium]|nr:bifunctional glutamate N-acetyltransferase/amino-acid acetyltransferase ArgJ [Candidatus Auribacterota bacterium]
MDTHPVQKTHGYITSPKGFRASGIACGIKKEGVRDLALIVSDVEAAAAGTFTTNRFCAAPVQICRTRLESGRAQAIVVNSGCANAATGVEGLADAEAVVAETARLLSIPPAMVLPASTGRIGRRLPLQKIKAFLPALVSGLSLDGGREAALAILTTNTVPKEAISRAAPGGRGVIIGGMAKGAGMIHPRMATMLAFITTDAAVSPATLQALLAASVDRSFNCITVDGDRSTNDSVCILANGRAGNQPITSPDSADARLFARALDEVTAALAEKIVRDGEGASKFVEITVRGARDSREARRLGFAVANSPLFKTAMYGEDPNWGRILSSLGAADIDFDPASVELILQGHRVFRAGAPVAADDASLKKSLKGGDIRIEVIMERGSAAERVLTCDLTPQYVDLNCI